MSAPINRLCNFVRQQIGAIQILQRTIFLGFSELHSDRPGKANPIRALGCALTFVEVSTLYHEREIHGIFQA